MAGNNVSATISVADSFTGPLRSMSNAVGQLSDQLKSLSGVSNQSAARLTGLESAAGALGSGINDLGQSFNTAAQSGENENQALRGTMALTEQAGSSVTGLSGELAEAAAQMGALSSIRVNSLGEMEDDAQSLEKALSDLGSGFGNSVNSIEEIALTSDKASGALDEMLNPSQNRLVSELSKTAEASGNTATELDRIDQINFSHVEKSAENTGTSVRKISSSADKVKSDLDNIGNTDGFSKISTAAGNTKPAFDNLSSSLKDIETKADQSFSSATQGAGNFTSKLSGVAKAALSAAAVVATIGVGKKVWNAANSVAEFGDNIDKTSQKIGISAQSYQEWSYVFERCGASVDNLQMGMKTLSSVITDAGSGSEEAAEKLAKVGLSVNDLAGRTQDEQLSIIISRLQEMGAGAERTAAATDLLGRSSVDMAAVLNTSAEETERLKQETHDYGMIMSDEGVKAAATFEDSLTKLKSTFTGIKNSIIGEFSPSLISAMDSFSDFASQLGGKIREAMNTESFRSGLAHVGETFDNLKPKIEELAISLTEKIPDVLDKVITGFSWVMDHGREIAAAFTSIVTAIVTFKTISTVTGIVSAFIGALSGGAGIFSAFGAALGAILSPVNLVAVAIAGLVAGITYLWQTNEGFRNAVVGIWNAIAGAFTSAGENIANFFSWLEGVSAQIPNFFSGIWNAIAGSVSGWFEEAVSWGSNLITGFFNGITAGWNKVTQWFSDSFNWIVNFVKGIFGIASPSTVFADIGSNLLAGLYNGITGFWGTITGWFNDTLMPFFSGIGEAIGNFFSNLFGGSSEQQAPEIDVSGYSQIVEEVRTQFEQLEAGIRETLNRLIIETGGALAALAENSVSLFSTITGSLSERLLALGTALSEMISSAAGNISLFSTSFEGLTGILGSIVTQFGVLNGTLSGSSALAMTFVAGFAGLEEINIQINSLIAGLSSLIAAFGETGASAMAELAGSIRGGAAAVTNALDELIGNLIAAAVALTVKFAAYGLAMTGRFAEGIRSGKPQVLNALSDLSGSVDQSMKGLIGRFFEYGSSMVNDLAAGIRSKTQTVTDATSELVEQIKSIFIEGLGIHSPSHFTEYIGEMMAAGLFKGLSNAQIQSFVESIVGNMKSAFEGGTFDPMQLVKYLDDDTLKLIEYLNLTGDSTTSEKEPADNNMIAYPLIGTKGTQTSWFGYRPPSATGGIGTTNHGGADLAAPTGTPIASALGGTVTTAGSYGGYGNAVVVDSGGGLSIVYGHMSQVGAAVGQQVQKGQQIGLVGSTGNSTGPHLHFEIRQDGKQIDPQPYLDGAAPLSGVPNTLSNSIQQAYNQYKGIVPVAAGSSNMGSIEYDISAGAEQWRPLVVQALTMLGQPTALADAVMATLDKESSGNPNAINDWDTNWQAGTPSKGLMQVIDPTFRTYALPGYDKNIWDPLSNILASLNYQLKVYGGISAHLNGYARGTDNAKRGLHWVGEEGPELLYFRGGETVIPHRQSLEAAGNIGLVSSQDATEKLILKELPGSSELVLSDSNSEFLKEATAASEKSSEFAKETEKSKLVREAVLPSDSNSEFLKEITSTSENRSEYQNNPVSASAAGGLNLSFGFSENADSVAEEPYIEPGENYQYQGGNTTNNTPVTLNFTPTIHTSEQFNVSMKQVEDAILGVLDDLTAKEAEGLYNL